METDLEGQVISGQGDGMGYEVGGSRGDLSYSKSFRESFVPSASRGNLTHQSLAGVYTLPCTHLPGLAHVGVLAWRSVSHTSVWADVVRMSLLIPQLIYFLKKILLFLERGEGREKNIDVRNIDQLLLLCALTKGQTHNPGMFPDGESNW